MEALLRSEGWVILQQHLDARRKRLTTELVGTPFADLGEVRARQGAIREIETLEGHIKTVIKRGQDAAAKLADNSGTGQ